MIPRITRSATLLVTVGAMALFGVPVFAQPSSTSLSSADRQYLAKSAQGSTHEFEVAQLGVEKASSPATEQYVQKLLDDHAQFNTQLMQLAHKKGVTLPVTADPSENKTITRLAGLSGTAFDRAFAQEMIHVNTEDISDSQKQLRVTRDADIRAFISQFASGDQQHLQGARSIAENTAQRSSR
jgi:putative membrane protein